jgi:hypothetical protein
MSQVTRTHGDSLPVFAIDTQNGPMTGALTVAGLVQAQGPALQFLAVDFGASVAAEVGTNGKIEKAIKALTTKATVHFYQVEAGAQMSIALYPAGAWTTTDAAAAVTAAVGAAATVTDLGFKLAAA